MKCFKLTSMFLFLLTTITFGSAADSLDEAQIRGGSCVITEGISERASLAGAVSYEYSSLRDDVFLRSDGSAARYEEFSVRNTGFEPIDSEAWCFYWGRDAYSHIFAKDASGYLDVNYVEDYSNEYGWGLCVEVFFRQAIEYGEVYTYALGITIDNHHKVQNDVIDAEWWVRSRVDGQTIHPLEAFCGQVIHPPRGQGIHPG
ncbi:MAG: hypothetical protein GXY76_16555 [Chloroflexi bacterium]|nr:hypothetical protein [Chloroflexota bacterium]